MLVRATAPGRVNLIGDHTDYTGGLVLPMAIDRATTIEGRRGGNVVRLRSREEPGEALFPITIENPHAIAPPWARYVAGVVKVIAPTQGFSGDVRSMVPVGAGLSSSAALEVAAALALGFDGSPRELAAACQEAEHVATGMPCGIMDQLTAAAGIEGHALLIDCATLDIDAVPLPDGADVWVFRTPGPPRRLVSSPYADRRAQCEAAAAIVGPLRDASLDELDAIADETVRRRARHVIAENARVTACAHALRDGDLATAGELMHASHVSLRDDFEVSTEALDELVASLVSAPGVYGARLTGAGFGGCVVALAAADARLPREGWKVRAAGPATVEQVGT